MIAFDRAQAIWNKDNNEVPSQRQWLGMFQNNDDTAQKPKIERQRLESIPQWELDSNQMKAWSTQDHGVD